MEKFKLRIPVDERIKEVTIYSTLDDILENTDVKYQISNALGSDVFENIKREIKENPHYGFAVVDYTNKTYEILERWEDVLNKYKTFKMFGKKERSTFKYWFAHWCAFQLTALNLGMWKFKYLFHDIEKPWLMLFWKKDYARVQQWHRMNRKHHLEYGLYNGFDKMDWEALVIDWECCGLTKQAAQLDARETLDYELKKAKWSLYANEIKPYVDLVLGTHGL